MSTEKEIKCKDCGERKINYGRGLCGKCYKRRKRAGEFSSRCCSVYECESPVMYGGRCGRHAIQYAKYGEIKGHPSISSRSPNIFIREGDTTSVELRNIFGELRGKAIIDSSDVDKCRAYKWCLASNGYVYGVHILSGKSISMHSLISGGDSSDHINRKKNDNRKKNLRHASSSQNQMNRKCGYGKVSKFKGIWKQNGHKKWSSRVQFNGKRYWVGTFKNEIDAALAYNKKAKEVAGEFAYQNKI